MMVQLEWYIKLWYNLIDFILLNQKGVLFIFSVFGS